MRRLGASVGASLLAAGILAISSAPAGAQDELERLGRLEEQLRQSQLRQEQLRTEAERLAAELGGISADLIAAAEEVLRLEAKTTAIETRMAGLRAEEAARAALAQRQSGEVAAVLASLARLSRQPPETLIAAPGAAIDIVRSSMLLASILPHLEARAEALSAELRAVRALREEIGHQQTVLAAALGRLAQQRAALAQLLERNAEQRQRTGEERAREGQRMEQLAAEAVDLRELIAGIEGDRGAIAELPPFPSRSFNDARGQLPLPVEGTVTVGFGAVDDFGAPSRGLTIETRENARVVAPFDGRIVFAGPFRSYGLLLIITHSEGYHTLVAGLSRIDGRVGQWLLAGEPIGVAGGGEAGKSVIYVELRREGNPINPSPWLAAR